MGRQSPPKRECSARSLGRCCVRAEREYPDSVNVFRGKELGFYGDLPRPDDALDGCTSADQRLSIASTADLSNRRRTVSLC